MPRISVDHGEVYLEDEGSGAPVLLLHGFTLDGRMWEPQRALAERWRLLRPDLRGFGRSAMPPTDRPYSHLDDLARVLDTISVDAVHVVGLSNGAGVATEFALAHPDRVRSLVLASPAVDGFDFAFNGPSPSAIVRAEGLPAALDAWLGSALFAHTMRHPTAGPATAEVVRGYSGVHWLADGSTEVRPAIPPIARLREIAVPVLVVAGDQDVPDFQRCAARVASDIPAARLEILQGVGHMLNLEAADRFNGLLEEFLNHGR